MPITRSKDTRLLISHIGQLAGCQRDKSFMLAATVAINHGFTQFIETGCYRGTDADGQSTVILGLLAAYQHGRLESFEISPDSISKATEKATGLLDYISFIQGDSLATLKERDTPINFAYLDSFDFHAEDHLPSQEHQLAEAKLILPLMTAPGMILLDDADLPWGGKTGLSAPFLNANGWGLIHQGYQLLFFKP